MSGKQSTGCEVHDFWVEQARSDADIQADATLAKTKYVNAIRGTQPLN